MTNKNQPIAIFSVIYVIYTILISLITPTTYLDSWWVLVMSWIGIFSFCYILNSYRKASGQWLSLYSIFVILCYLFNYGQCLFWAFGVHLEQEIGTSLLYGYYGTNDAELFRAQAYFLCCMHGIHAAYMNTMKTQSNLSSVSDSAVIPNDWYNRYVFKASKYIAFLVMPVTLMLLLNNISVASTSGYKDLYYGDQAGGGATIMTFSNMFFVCIIGLLVGSRYAKKQMLICYALFAIYILLDLSTGDRGGWFYRLLILFWMHHYFYKKFTKGQILRLGIMGFGALFVIQGIVAMRNFGVSIESVQEAMSDTEVNPLVAMVFEMGGQMKINIMAVNHDINYPYGNSIFLGLLAMVTMKIPALLGISYEPITSWFSDKFLQIDYGAGFSLFGEMAINFGVHLAPLAFIVFGLIVTNILNVAERPGALNAKQLLFAIGSASFLFGSIRNTFHDLFKYWFIGLVLYFVLMKIINVFSSRKQEI